MRDHVADATIVDPHQVIAAPLGIWKIITVQKHNRNIRLLKRRHDALVDRLLVWNMFEGRKEDAAHLAAYVAMAQL